MAKEAVWPEVDWRHPSPRLRRMRRAEVSSLTALVALIAAAAAAAGGSNTGAAVAVAVVFLVGGGVDWFVGRRVRAWAFAERDEDLLVRRGVMIRRLSVIPYGRMQYVDVTAGPIERTFGLATVRMHTAAAASDARVPGLSAEDAATLRDNLTRLGEARAAGL